MAVLSELNPSLDEKLHENATAGEMKLAIRGIRITTLQLLVFLAREYLRFKFKLLDIDFSEFEGHCHIYYKLTADS